MARTTRRKLLAGAAALTAGLAGCTEDATNNTGSGDGFGSGNENTEQTETIADSTEDVEEDGYTYWTFSGPGTVEWDFIVRDGPNVDVYLMPRDEFDHYQAEERFKVNGDSSNSAGDRGSATVGNSDYVLVIDNTNAGSASPPSNLQNDIAKVEMEATRTY